MTYDQELDRLSRGVQTVTVCIHWIKTSLRRSTTERRVEHFNASSSFMRPARTPFPAASSKTYSTFHVSHKQALTHRAAWSCGVSAVSASGPEFKSKKPTSQICCSSGSQTCPGRVFTNRKSFHRGCNYLKSFTFYLTGRKLI